MATRIAANIAKLPGAGAQVSLAALSSQKMKGRQIAPEIVAIDECRPPTAGNKLRRLSPVTFYAALSELPRGALKI